MIWPYTCKTVSGLHDSQVLQSEVDSLQCWERTSDVAFNPSKCQVDHITRPRNSIMSRYFMHNQELESVGAAKYLGMNISKDLS